ncbi:MAG: pilus assembly protein PilM [Burkholderiales bacterium]|nr:pilus assembly protein PilM [Burkholderiales bacterium]
MPARDLTLPSYGARVRDFARRSGLAGFWAWWMRELGPQLPAAARTALARRRTRPVLVFAGDHATLWRPVIEGGDISMRSAATLALAGDAAADGRAALLSPGEAATPRVVVSLAPQDVLRKKVVLPAAVEENLVQALAYDLDRHTPFKPEELYFDAVVVDRDPARGTITVDLAAARRSAVDPALRQVAAWGGEVVAIVPDPPATSARSRLNLLPVQWRSTRALWRRWQFWVPVILLAVLAAAAIAIPLWQKREYAIELAQQADQARARAAVSETLRAELNARVGDYNYALERKYAFPGMLAVVDTVSKVLPDDTWLTQLEMKTMAKGKDVQRELLLRGETANAGKLVQLFEESPMFAQPAQRGPTTKIQPGPGEIFDLGMQLRQRPPPAAVAIAVPDKPPPGEPPSQPSAGAPAPAPADPAKAAADMKGKS